MLHISYTSNNSHPLRERKRAKKAIIFKDCTPEQIAEHKKLYLKKYRLENKETLINTYNKWIEDHPSYQINYYKEYSQRNKERLKERTKLKIFCNTCNCLISKHHKQKHYKSNKHKNNLILENLY